MGKGMKEFRKLYIIFVLPFTIHKQQNSSETMFKAVLYVNGTKPSICIWRVFCNHWRSLTRYGLILH
uniref:Uncharacterized protein n=1 Tax=Arundo donax TaxID=35708 RepID=A0A0A9AUU7_ARUDO